MVKEALEDLVNWEGLPVWQLSYILTYDVEDELHPQKSEGTRTQAIKTPYSYFTNSIIRIIMTYEVL